MLNFKNTFRCLILLNSIWINYACSSNDHLPKNGEYGRHLDVDKVLSSIELQQLGIGIEDNEFSNQLQLRFSADPEENPYRLVMITRGVAVEDVKSQFEWNVQLFSDTDGEANLMNNRATTQVLERAVKLKKGQEFLFVDPIESYTIPSKVERYELGVMLSLKQPKDLKIKSVVIQLWSNRELKKEQN